MSKQEAGARRFIHSAVMRHSVSFVISRSDSLAVSSDAHWARAKLCLLSLGRGPLACPGFRQSPLALRLLRCDICRPADVALV